MLIVFFESFLSMPLMIVVLFSPTEPIVLRRRRLRAICVRKIDFCRERNALDFVMTQGAIER